MHGDDFIESLGNELNLPGLAFDEHGVCTLEVHDSLSVNLEWDKDAEIVHVHSMVGAVPVDHEDGPEWSRKLLEANQFGHQTARATLAVHNDTIVLCRGFELPGLAFPSFFQSFERFVDAAHWWRERLSAPLAEADSTVSDNELETLHSGDAIRV